jgi:hypothetical protein
MTHIMDRMQGRPGTNVLLTLALILIMPSWSEAASISSSQGQPLREILTAGSTPLSNHAIVDFLVAGKPVSETTTTSYDNGAAQTADLWIVPDLRAGTVTVTKDVHFADGKTEKVVDVAKVNADSVKNDITRTLPNGSTQTTNETEVTNGANTTITGTAVLPGGVKLSISGTTVKDGWQFVTDKTITTSSGQVYHDHMVTTANGDHSVTQSHTADGPGGAALSMTSVTKIVLNPSAVAQSGKQAGLNVPTAKVGAQSLKLESQEIAPSSMSSDTSGTILPAAVPEPGSLVVFSVVLLAATLCRGLHSRRAACGA